MTMNASSGSPGWSMREHCVRAFLPGRDPGSCKIMWLFGGTGGTKSSMAATANCAMAESAIYLADGKDVVYAPHNPDEHLWVDDVESLRVGQGRTVRVGDSPANRADEWLCSHPLEAEPGRRADAIICSRVNPSVERLAFLLEIPVLSVPARLQASMEDRARIHSLLDDAGVSRPRSCLCHSARDLRCHLRLRLSAGWGSMIKNTLPNSRCLAWPVLRKRDIDATAAALERHEFPVLVEDIHAVVDSMNTQFFIRNEGTTLLGASLQLVTACAPCASTKHAGNVLPAEYAVDSPWHQRHVDLARAAAECAREAGYVGLVGVDTIRNREGECFVVDVNARINASTFLLCSRRWAKLGRVHMWFFAELLGPRDERSVARLRGAISDAVIESGARIRIATTPPYVPDRNAWAINVVITGDSVSQVSSSCRHLCTGLGASLITTLDRLSGTTPGQDCLARVSLPNSAKEVDGAFT